MSFPCLSLPCPLGIVCLVQAARPDFDNHPVSSQLVARWSSSSAQALVWVIWWIRGWRRWRRWRRLNSQSSDFSMRDNKRLAGGPGEACDEEALGPGLGQGLGQDEEAGVRRRPLSCWRFISRKVNDRWIRIRPRLDVVPG